MTERVHVEFEIAAGKRDVFLKTLQRWDENDNSLLIVGFRADDALDHRVALKVFVSAMEVKLRKNEHKKNWKEKPVEALLRLMLLEIEEFKVALEFFDVKEAMAELPDISNFAMMLYDRLGALDRDQPLKGQEE